MTLLLKAFLAEILVYWREALIAVLGLLLVHSYAVPSAPRVITTTVTKDVVRVEYVDKIKVVEKEVIKWKARQVITKTVTIRPDGTSINKERVEHAQSQQEEKSSSAVQERKETTELKKERREHTDKGIRSQYGLRYRLPLAGLRDYKLQGALGEIQANVRLGNSPFHLGASYDFTGSWKSPSSYGIVFGVDF